MGKFQNPIPMTSQPASQPALARINLRDGAKVELFGLLNFYDNYKFMLSRPASGNH